MAIAISVFITYNAYASYCSLRSYKITNGLEARRMIEVYPNLFVGNRHDYETIVSGQNGWAIVHACKQYHRKTLGYKTWRAPKNHPEYLVARRENRLMLCLLDLPIPLFI